MVRFVDAAIQVVDLVDQRVVGRVSEDAGNGSHDEGTSTDAKHPNLGINPILPGEVVDNVPVHLGAFLFCLRGQGAVLDVVEETAVQSDPVKVASAHVSLR